MEESHCDKPFTKLYNGINGSVHHSTVVVRQYKKGTTRKVNDLQIPEMQIFYFEGISA